MLKTIHDRQTDDRKQRQAIAQPGKRRAFAHNDRASQKILPVVDQWSVLDALASLKTMIKIKLLMFSRF